MSDRLAGSPAFEALVSLWQAELVRALEQGQYSPIPKIAFALHAGAYVRCGETGRGQIWWHRQYQGHCGPRRLRELKRDPSVVERILFVRGVPIRALCSINLKESANGPEQNCPRVVGDADRGEAAPAEGSGVDGERAAPDR